MAIEEGYFAESIELKVPVNVKSQFDNFVKRGQGSKDKDLEISPFNTMLELWFLSVCIGARNNEQFNTTNINTTTFIRGNIFVGNDSNGLSRKWMIEILEAIAIATENTHEIINDPKDVIRIANNFAAGGIADTLQMLEGEGFALANLHQNILPLLETADY